MTITGYIETLDEIIEDLKSDSFSHAKERRIEKLIDLKSDLKKLETKGFQILDFKDVKPIKIDPVKTLVEQAVKGDENSLSALKGHLGLFDGDHVKIEKNRLVLLGWDYRMTKEEMKEWEIKVRSL